jgi:hypothetical protein
MLCKPSLWVIVVYVVGITLLRRTSAGEQVEWSGIRKPQVKDHIGKDVVVLV